MATTHIHVSDDNAASAQWLAYSATPSIDYVEGNGNVYFKDVDGDISAIIPLTTNSIAAEQYKDAPITSIHIPSKINEIGDNAFNNSKLATITVPSTVTTIGDGAFRNITTLQSINWQSATKIPENCFAYCEGMTTTDNLTIATSCTTISSYAFRNSGFVDFIMPDSITTIGNYMMYHSDYIESVDFGNVTRISYGCCFYSNQLKYITIGAAATTIQQMATSTAADKIITIKATTPPSLSASTAFGSIDKISVIYVPAASVEQYKTASNWSALAEKIQPITT